MNKKNSSNQSANLDRRDFIKNTAIVSLAASSGLSSFPQLLKERVEAAEPASANAIVKASPYGVCAHVGGGEEFAQAPKNLLLMKDAGISWVRCDFTWGGVENPEGQWHFDTLDKIVDESNQLGLQLLPILDYSVPWATPSYKYLDKWLKYVKQIVTRYKDRIQYWEVWNEENLESFWRDKPTGESYATLLKATYQTIKEIDPNLIVVYGGLAGVPVDYFEKSLEAGAGDFFDVVNIHPYRGGLTTPQRIDRFAQDIEAFRKALKKYNLPERPIWITEMGWATPPIFGESNRRVVTAALHKLFPNEDPKVAFFYDERYDPSQSRSRIDCLNYLPEKYSHDASLSCFLDADALKKITCADADMLVMPPSESFPADCFEAMVRFVKDGGALVFLGGVPLYYESWIDKSTGRYEQSKSNPHMGDNMNALRISWYAWWTRENVPEQVPTVVSPDSADEMQGFFPVHQATRFFDAAKLKEGDKMISLLDGKNDSFTGSCSCIYDFNSDYKGAVVINSVMDDDGNGTNRSTVANQAVFLTQAYLLALANGIERFFWYEFHAPERDQRDPEHHFGIVGQKLDPKPGYYAYKTLTKARPASSQGADLTSTDNCCLVSWKRPDGQKGYALWAPRAQIDVKVKISGAVANAFDYLGNEVTKPNAGVQTLKIAPGVLYLIGPDDVQLQ